MKLTSKLEIAFIIVFKVSLCDVGWKGGNGCKCDSKKYEALIKHDWEVFFFFFSFELRRGNITTKIKILCFRVENGICTG